MSKITNERLGELIRWHKEWALKFEEISDGGRLVGTLDAAIPHWEQHDALRELFDYRKAVAEYLSAMDAVNAERDYANRPYASMDAAEANLRALQERT